MSETENLDYLRGLDDMADIILFEIVGMKDLEAIKEKVREMAAGIHEVKVGETMRHIGHCYKPLGARTTP